jgi:hypothetical protein
VSPPQHVDGELAVAATLESERQIHRTELDSVRIAVEEATDLPVVFTARVELIITVGGAVEPTVP